MTLWRHALMSGVLLTFWVAGCTPSPSLSLNQEIRIGDRLRDWSLVYYQSWVRSRDPDFLRLSREHMASAVGRYFELQVRIGHRIPEFYDIDKRRLTGCRFLLEVDRTARVLALDLDDGREGCLQ